MQQKQQQQQEQQPPDAGAGRPGKPSGGAYTPLPQPVADALMRSWMDQQLQHYHHRYRHHHPRPSSRSRPCPHLKQPTWPLQIALSKI